VKIVKKANCFAFLGLEPKVMCFSTTEGCSLNIIAYKQDNLTTTYYVDKEYEYETIYNLSNRKTTKVMKHHLYNDANQIVATHFKTLIDDEKQVDKISYFHKDSLNTIDTVTNSNGKVVARNIYTPFGALASSTNPSSDKRFKKEDFKGYTSHEQYFDLNLINMGGRMYDPTISRFISADIFIQSPTNSQSFNRYAYVVNNPMKS